jgi:predicted Zn finger-like uncharacterized protein
MDVRCDRCGTEYEFDDALVSERGTSVKCTTCGHQFKVFRPRVEGAVPEQWVIRAADGRELVFHSLRELKAGIMARQVVRTDRIARGTGPVRALGSIPELTSFFDDAERASRTGQPSTARVPTPLGLGAQPAASSQERGSGRTIHGVPPSPHSVSPASLPPPSAEPEPPTARKPAASAPPGSYAPGSHALGSHAPGSHAPGSHSPGSHAPPAYHEPPAPQPPAPALVEPPRGEPQAGPDAAFDQYFRDSTTNTDQRFSGDMLEDPTAVGRTRGGAGRWVVAVVVLGTLGVIGGAMGKQFLVNNEASRTQTTPSAAPDGRVKELLLLGDRAMAEGDLEGAQENLVKASAIAENDPRVQVGLSRLWAMRADVAWLRLKVLPASATDARNVARRELTDASARAKKSADRAAESAPDESSVTRVKVDALRLLEDRGVARALAPRLAPTGTQPETAYVLAALDLGESPPPWKSVIERLQLASTAESLPGRARAALVYALAQSGDVASARAELDRMASASRPYPLVPDLRAMLASAAGAPSAPSAEGPRDAGTDGGKGGGASVDITSLPAAPVPTWNPNNTGAATPPVVADAPKGGPGEFSEEELHKKLFGDADRSGKPPKPADEKKDTPKVDTSDLPGVKAPP